MGIYVWTVVDVTTLIPNLHWDIMSRSAKTKLASKKTSTKKASKSSAALKGSKSKKASKKTSAASRVSKKASAKKAGVKKSGAKMSGAKANQTKSMKTSKDGQGDYNQLGPAGGGQDHQEVCAEGGASRQQDGLGSPQSIPEVDYICMHHQIYNKYE